jgi:hypothetical protein
MAIKVRWIDAHREPQCEPNPKYPKGMDVNLALANERKCCVTTLPYPALRIGAYLVECDICGFRAYITTAGRPDDPRSARLPCRKQSD